MASRSGAAPAMGAYWLAPARRDGPGRYSVRIWKDAPDAASEPNHLTTETLTLSSVGTLKIRFAPDGGFVAQLARVGN